MNKLSNEDLLLTFIDAIKYKCDIEFIQMLALELQFRGLSLPEEPQQYSA